ncbi:hypothetical protein VoSk93_04790 [Vibrio owensii]|uniref:hypothetical protein n=1 Tax=Vibrio harveyi group TaxID=717610 RepID=UPI0003A2CEF6|nr:MULTISPECIES: hypothetical protein [Vibrio harveyi group]
MCQKTFEDLNRMKVSDFNESNIYDFQGVEVECNSEHCQGASVCLVLYEEFVSDDLKLACPACGEVFVLVEQELPFL